MAKIYTHMTMSLDGYIADPEDGTGELFDWYGAGDVTVPSADERWSFQVDANSAEMLRETFSGVGSLVCGRRLSRSMRRSGPVTHASRRTRSMGTSRSSGRVPVSWNERGSSLEASALGEASGGALVRPQATPDGASPAASRLRRGRLRVR
jgi:hypothetical protein